MSKMKFSYEKKKKSTLLQMTNPNIWVILKNKLSIIFY